MRSGATIAFLPDGRRLHMNHGPIDLVVEAFGPEDESKLAYAQAAAAFDGLLEGLVAELVQLRKPIENDTPALSGPLARRMGAAAWPHRKVFVTPMAAVAGAVADHVLEAMVAGRRLERAYVNNGGDIALHLSEGQRFCSGVVQRLEAPNLDGIAAITAAMPVRGLATSGWRGRSHSLGVADAVTALARTAAAADVAATLIANAVRVDNPAVSRAPASELDADTDLGDRLVTVDVGPLDSASVATALDAGVAAAEGMRARGLVWGAVLALQGALRVLGPERLISQTAA
jgi:hypothetical protein